MTTHGILPCGPAGAVFLLDDEECPRVTALIIEAQRLRVGRHVLINHAARK